MDLLHTRTCAHNCTLARTYACKHVHVRAIAHWQAHAHTRIGVLMVPCSIRLAGGAA